MWEALVLNLYTNFPLNCYCSNSTSESILKSRCGGGWSKTRPDRFTPGKDPVPIVMEAEWAPGPVWKGAENLAPTRIRSPERPACSESLYRLRYPGPEVNCSRVYWYQKSKYRIMFISWLKKRKLLSKESKGAALTKTRAFQCATPIKVVTNIQFQAVFLQLRTLTSFTAVLRSLSLLNSGIFLL